MSVCVDCSTNSAVSLTTDHVRTGVRGGSQLLPCSWQTATKATTPVILKLHYTPLAGTHSLQVHSLWLCADWQQSNCSLVIHPFFVLVTPCGPSVSAVPWKPQPAPA